MKMRPSVLLLVVCLFSAFGAAAQNWPFPGKVTPVPCTGCPGELEGLPTWPYNDPLAAYVGRTVDSTTTISVQHAGMRTVRARAIRVSPATGRIYLALGEAVGGYPLNGFFTTILRQPMVPVSVMKTGSTNYLRNPLEKVAPPDSFHYPEATTSGWQTSLVDAQRTLTDFDADDRGYVYVGSVYFGWGIARDVDVPAGKHMTFIAQVQDTGFEPASVISLKSGTQYYAVISQGATNAAQLAIYNVTEPAVPQRGAGRSGMAFGIVRWAKYDEGQRLAVLNSDGHVRIYDYATFLSGGAALADYTPSSAAKKFNSIAFDEAGTLWMVEGPKITVTASLIWKAVPGGEGYIKSSVDVYGSATFNPVALSVGGGYLAVAGREGTVQGLLLFRVTAGIPSPVDTDNFFTRYYHRAPDGYAAPGDAAQSWVSFSAVQIVEQDAKTYLIYHAEAIGDVYELERTVDENRIGTSISLTSSPNPSSNGQTVTITATVTAQSVGAAPPEGVVTFTIDGVAAATATVTPGLSNTFLATVTRTDLNVGPHAITASFEGDDHYEPSGPANHTHQGAAPTPVIVATANGTSSVGVTWTTIAGYEYQLFRSNANSPFAPVGPRLSGGAYTDLNVVPGTTYLYKVQSFEGDVAGPTSKPDQATTMVFTDPNLVTGGIVKEEHIADLRVAVNALRNAAGLTPAAFTDSTLTNLPIRAVHLTELRNAINQARAAIGLAAMTGTFVNTGLPVRRVDVENLRAAVQ